MRSPLLFHVARPSCLQTFQAAYAVSSFAASPVTIPGSPSARACRRDGQRLPRTLKGRIRRVINAFALDLRAAGWTAPVEVLMPFSCASSGLISMKSSGWSSVSQGPSGSWRPQVVLGEPVRSHHVGEPRVAGPASWLSSSFQYLSTGLDCWWYIGFCHRRLDGLVVSG